MLLMFAGFALFFGTHLMQVVAPVRAGIVSAIGETPYKIAYSLVALGGLILIVEGYKAWTFAGSPLLYSPPTWLAHLSLLLMAFASILFVATYPPSHIKKWVKHPMITSVKIWAFAHLLAVGHAAAVTLYGAFLAWGVVTRISEKRRERAGLTRPGAFEPKWSADVIVIAIGLALYVLFVWRLHLWLIGVSPIST